MFTKKRSFELYDRKLILYFFDSFFVLLTLYSFGVFFELDYLFQLVFSFKNACMFILYLVFFGSVFELYNIQVANNEFRVLKSITLTVSFTVLVYMLTPIFTPVLPANRLQIVLFYGLFFIALYIWRLFYVKFLSSTMFLQKAVLICDEEEAEFLLTDFEGIDPNYKIIGCITTESTICTQFNERSDTKFIDKNLLDNFIKNNNITEIIVASKIARVISLEMYHQLLDLLKTGISIRIYDEAYENKTQRIPVQFVSKDFYRFFPFSKNHSDMLYITIIGLVEYVFSIVGLFFGGLLLPIIIVGNLIGNKGSLFYTQTRIGKNGKPFEIIKLRTMVKNAETNGAVFATVNDARITVFGKFLRKTRIDEIPQFINILKGEMAVIGPRPERPEIVDKIVSMMPIYETRHVIKPGITGWAQVNYSYGENIEDSLVKLQYDLYYIKNRSIHLDINIAIKTITTILFYRGQ